MSPSATYNYTSHNTVQSSPTSHGTAIHSATIPNQQLLAPPCQSSPHVNMGSPPSQARPGTQVTAHSNASPIWNSSNSSNIYTNPLSNSSCPTPQNGEFYNSLDQDNRTFGTNLSEEKDPLAMSPTNQPDQQSLVQTQEKTFEQGMLYNLQLGFLAFVIIYGYERKICLKLFNEYFRWECGDKPIARTSKRSAFTASPRTSSATTLNGCTLCAIAAY